MQDSCNQDPQPVHDPGLMECFSRRATACSGSAWAFALALGVVVVWLVSGPLFNFSDTWQLVINTGTTIVTFLMVFLIQRSQNKDAMAIQLKLNETVAALKGASNRMVSVEDLSEEEVESLHRHYHQLATLASQTADITESHSIEEADKRHQEKTGKAKGKPAKAKSNGRAHSHGRRSR